MTRRMAVSVRGRQHDWTFFFDGDPEYVEGWRADGLESLEVENAIPKWIVDLGLMRVWVFFEDVFKFRNPFKK